MFLRRRNLKLAVAFGVFFLFYVYIIIFSSSIDLFLTRSLRHSVADVRNKSKVMSPFEGPVDDLLDGKFHLEVDARGAGDDKVTVGLNEWRKGLRGDRGFRDRFVKAERKETEEPVDNPLDGVEDELRDAPPGRLGPVVAEEQRLDELQPIEDPKTRLKKGRRKGDIDCCIEVKKNKMIMEVQFPPFVKYGKPGDPGENGIAVTWRPHELSQTEMAQKDKDFNVHFFDEWTSRKIAVHRTLPDDREPECKIRYPYLPVASVVIVFHNEAWTTLLRSIHSILDRTPAHLLEEVILLDDFSDMDHLQKPLEAYIQLIEKVKLFRATKRLGLIRARNIAFEHSKGQVVIFLDSHIECFPGWIEPLLAPIRNDTSVITFPSIEYINSHSFSTAVSTNRPRPVGGLNINSLVFTWLYDRKYNDSRTLYYPSPTMPGGLYAVSREWFSRLGKYDPGLDIWGGENIEISFKSWMCGGSILLALCSHIGHIFRNFNPNMRGFQMTYKNSVRVAEVWMDQYKHFFYEKIGYNLPTYGNITSRVQLRQSLKCSNFGWYLMHVFPELKKKMDVRGLYYGEIRSIPENVCLSRQESTIAIDSCRLGALNQQWQYGNDKRIVSGEFILGVREEVQHGGKVWHIGIFNEKHFDQTVSVYWRFEQQRLQNSKVGLCLQINMRSRSVELKACSGQSEEQKWKLTTRKENQELMRNRGVNIDWSV